MCYLTKTYSKFMSEQKHYYTDEKNAQVMIALFKAFQKNDLY